MTIPSHRILTPAQFHLQRWKNGGGSTLELWRRPESDADFEIRISVATVAASGPFSLFPGVDRTIIQLSGPPMVLTHDSAPPLALKIGVPHHFRGEIPTECVVTGESQDFNVMVQRGDATAICQVIEGPKTLPLNVNSNSSCLIYAWRSSDCNLRLSQGSEPLIIPELHLMELTCPPSGTAIQGVLSVNAGLSILLHLSPG